MANLDEIKKRLQAIQSKGGGGDQKRYVSNTDRLLKLEPGETVVRIVPYKENKDNPFSELYFHYNINNKSYLSPQSYGNSDPFVEFAEKLRGSGDKEDYMLSKQLMPKLRVFAPVVVRGKESEGVKFWGFGYTTYVELLKYMADPDYGDITDVNNGHDIVLEKPTKQATGKEYNAINFRIKPKPSKLANSNEEIVAIVRNQIPITDIYSEVPYDELKIILENWLTSDGSSAMESETQKTLATKSKPEPMQQTVAPEATKRDAEPPTEKSASNIDDISAAFDDLFGDDLPF